MDVYVVFHRRKCGWGNMTMEMFTEWGNDALLWLCIHFMYGWPVCSSKYFSRCSSVCFFVVDPFCWTRKEQTKRNHQLKHCMYALHMTHIMFVRYGRPKIDVHYTYYLSTHCFFTDYSAGILMVLWWYSDGICPKIHIYTNVFDLAFFYTYTHYATRFLLISWVCICTSQDNDTHVFGRFFHWKNPLYFIDFFKTKKFSHDSMTFKTDFFGPD